MGRDFLKGIKLDKVINILEFIHIEGGICSLYDLNRFYNGNNQTWRKYINFLKEMDIVDYVKDKRLFIFIDKNVECLVENKDIKNLVRYIIIKALIYTRKEKKISNQLNIGDYLE